MLVKKCFLALLSVLLVGTGSVGAQTQTGTRFQSSRTGKDDVIIPAGKIPKGSVAIKLGMPELVLTEKRKVRCADGTTQEQIRFLKEGFKQSGTDYVRNWSGWVRANNGGAVCAQ